MLECGADGPTPTPLPETTHYAGDAGSRRK